MTATAMGSAVTSAQDAVTRLDEGAGRPGDEALANAYDEYCRQEWLVLEDRRQAEAFLSWLATQCPVCVTDGMGQECDRCFLDHDQAMRRAEDQ